MGCPLYESELAITVAVAGMFLSGPLDLLCPGVYQRNLTYQERPLVFSKREGRSCAGFTTSAEQCKRWQVPVSQHVVVNFSNDMVPGPLKKALYFLFPVMMKYVIL